MSDRVFTFKCRKCKEKFDVSEAKLKQFQTTPARGFGKNPWAADKQAIAQCPHCGKKNKVSF